jgi:hypothetical protein
MAKKKESEVEIARRKLKEARSKGKFVTPGRDTSHTNEAVIQAEKDFLRAVNKAKGRKKAEKV